MTRGRRRQVDTSTHFCPNPDCAYRGWVGWGNLRANGHPSGGPWRQLLCVVCRRYFLETLGTIFHGKRASVELIVRVIACLAEGLGIRGTARVFEVDPNTVLQWLVEAAEQLRAFSQHVLHDVRVRQVQLDELFALLSAVKDGEVSEAEAIERLERSPQWVWVAMDPESKLLLAIDVGRSHAGDGPTRGPPGRAGVGPRLRPAVSHRWLPGVSDGLADPLWAVGAAATPPGHRPRAQAALDAAARSCSMRRWSRPCGAGAWCACSTAWCLAPWRPSMHVLAPLGWQINTAFVERINLTIRQHVAAVGRRVSTLCKGEDGLRQQLALYHCLLQFLFAPCQLTPAPAAARAHPRHRLGQAVAALYAGDGGGADRPCLDPARGAAVSRAAVAPASGGVSTPWWWEAARGGGLSRRRASARPASRASPGVRGPLGCHEGPLV